MVVAAFSVIGKANRVKFFEKTFLVANISPEVVLKMIFLILRIENSGGKHTSPKRPYPTTKCVRLVRKKEFATVVFDLEYKTFVVHVASLNSTPFNIYLFWKLQIFGLIAEEASTKISDKYINFVDIFSLNLVSKLPKYIGINDYTIELVEG